MYCIIEATDRHEASRGLSATAGLLVFSDASKITENVVHKYCLIKWIVKFLNKMYNKKRKKIGRSRSAIIRMPQRYWLAGSTLQCANILLSQTSIQQPVRGWCALVLCSVLARFVDIESNRFRFS